jgi:hypothetical protein
VDALLAFPLPLSSFRTVLASFVLLSVLLVESQANAQQTPAPQWLEVIVEAKDKEAEQSLSQTDFQITEGRTTFPIVSLAGGSAGPLRPLLLWFVVNCASTTSGSAFILGKTDLFTPILQKLPAADTVAVADLCGSGKTAVALAPTADRAEPAKALHTILSAAPVTTPNLPGENPLLDVVERIRNASSSLKPQSMPVLIFLYRDYTQMHLGPLENIIRDVLRSPGIVYNLDNGATKKPVVVAVDPSPIPDYELQVIHFLARETGGQVYSSWTNKYAENLDRLIGDLHRRYEIGFVPPNLDDQRHQIKIKLTDEGRRKVKSADLKYATTYFAPLPPAPVTAAPSQQDVALTQALDSETQLTDIRFDASGKIPANEQSGQFRIYVDPRSLSWETSEGMAGDVQAKFTLVTACLAADRTILSNQMKEFSVARSKADQSGGSPKAVILGISVPVPANTARVRFVIRDSAGHQGSFQLTSAQIKREAPSDAKVH